MLTELGWRATFLLLDLSNFGYSVIHRAPSALADQARLVRDATEWLAGREADLRHGVN